MDQWCNPFFGLRKLGRYLYLHDHKNSFRNLYRSRNPRKVCIMPTIGTAGAASARAFGFTGVATSGSVTVNTSGSGTFTVPVAVLSYTTDSTTDALTSITISKVTVTAILPVNSTVTITQPILINSGYYLQFTSPVPYGKIVIALIGFDS